MATRDRAPTSYRIEAQLSDLSALDEAIEGSSGDVRQLEPGPMPVVLRRAAGSTATVDSGFYGLRVRALVQIPADSITVCWMRTPTGRFHGRTMLTNDLLVYGPGSELAATGWGAWETVTVSVESLRTHLGDEWALPSPQSVRLLQGDRARATAVRGVADAALGRADDARPLGDLATYAVVEAIADVVAERATEPSVGRPERTQLVRRAEELIDAGGRLGVTDLCAAVGVSGRVLRYAFERELGVTPKQYLTTRRLNEARRALLAASPGETTVTDVAYGVGFTHLTRFAACYRGMFGEPPSQTLRRAPAPALPRRRPGNAVRGRNAPGVSVVLAVD